MDIERARAALLSIRDVTETEQFGGLVYWAADKAIGGRMFAWIGMDHPERLISFAAGQERFAELVELDGFRPAPYLARAWWITAARWGVFSNAEWEREFHQAHALTHARLPPKTRAILALPKAEQKRIVLEKKRLLAAKQKPR